LLFPLPAGVAQLRGIVNRRNRGSSMKSPFFRAAVWWPRPRHLLAKRRQSVVTDWRRSNFVAARLAETENRAKRPYDSDVGNKTMFWMDMALR
jgi:hypothetical protein